MDTEEKIIASKLVVRICSGDRGAESEMIQRYSSGLMMLLRKRSGDAMLAEDLHQDCLAVVLTRLRKNALDEPAKLSHFIHRTAINLLIAHKRKLARQRTNTDVEMVNRTADNSQGPSETVDRRQVAAFVRLMLDELHVKRDRIMLTRYYLKQDDKNEICDDLGISGEHFNRVLFRARGRFRNILERDNVRQQLRVVQ